MSGGKRMSKLAPKATRKPKAKPAKKARAAAKAAEPAMDLEVGRRIRDLRRARELSLETVAARTNLSIGFISQIERGLSSPSLRVLATLADVLGVGIAALFGARPSGESSTGDELYAHDGEEAGLVLEGEMTLTVDAETWSLKTGDSFRFASRRPHRFSNPADDAKAVVLWVNCVTAAAG